MTIEFVTIEPASIKKLSWANKAMDDEEFMEWFDHARPYIDGALVELVDGNYSRFVAADGGEPEDNSFYRDLSWVVDELNALAKKVK